MGALIMTFLTKYFNILKRYKIQLIVISASYFLGVILGMWLPSFKEKLFFGESTVNLFISCLLKGGKVSNLFLNRLFTDIFCLIIFYLTSINIYLVSVNILILIYRGYILGAIMISLIGNYGLTGFMLFFLVVFLQNIITTFILAVFTTLSIYYLKHKNNCKNILKGDGLLPALIVGFIGIIAGVLIQILVLLMFLRPMNYYF